MIVTPSFTTPKPIALVTPGWRSLRVQTVDYDTEYMGPGRVATALALLSGHVVYCKGLLGLLHTTGAESWEASSWKGRAISMTLDGTTTKVLSLRDALGEGTDDFGALCTVAAWLAGHGVRMGSLSSIAWHLWCATLTNDVSIASLPALGSSAFYGPRQEVREPRTYSHMACIDIGNAYPAAMVTRPYALTLREVSNATTLDPDQSGLARAGVRVPHALAFAPLPTRVAPGVIQWHHGDFHGTWTWAELAYAKALGCEVNVERCFAPMTTMQPFGEWYRLLGELRALPGQAGALGRVVGQQLWGMFAITGEHAATVRWHDAEHPIVVGRPVRQLPQRGTAHIAAETAARVRTQTLTEVYKMSAYPIHIDTDGIIVRRSVAKGYPRTAPAGQFRRKTNMVKCQMRAPQLYRYHCDKDCCLGHSTNWHYVAAGMTNHAAAELFDRVATPSRVSVLGPSDVVLPPHHNYADDPAVRRLEPWLHEAHTLRMALFGPGLPR